MSDDMELENFIEPGITVKTGKISETEMDEKNPTFQKNLKNH
jgi:hypothetical protein